MPKASSFYRSYVGKHIFLFLPVIFVVNILKKIFVGICFANLTLGLFQSQTSENGIRSIFYGVKNFITTSDSFLGLNIAFIFFFKVSKEFQPPYCCFLHRFMLNMYFPASRDADSV